MLDAKYGEVSTDDVVDQLTHLNDKQKQDLKVLLKDFTKSFDGTLGVYPHKNFHINLVSCAQSKHTLLSVLTEIFKYMLWVIADYWVLYPVTNIAFQGQGGVCLKTPSRPQV